MMTTHLPAILLAMGHLIAMILILNSSHGIGVNFPRIDQVMMLGVGLSGVVGAWLVYKTWGQPWTSWNWVIQLYSIPCFFLSLIAFPFVTVLRQFRTPPSEALLTRRELIDVKTLAPISELVGSGPRSRLLGLSFNDSLRLNLSDWTLSLDDLPQEYDGLTILHITDLHFAKTFGRRFFKEAIAAAIADSPEPDLIAITGDFIDDDECIGWIYPMLGQLRARLGKFAILGNHDFLHDVEGLMKELDRSEFTVLDAQWQMIEQGGSRLAIGGTCAPWGRDISRVPTPDAGFRLLLSHSPDQIYRAKRLKVQLMLCGHNHGGQVRLPVLGPILMPSLYSRRFDRGFFRSGRTLMFVGQGLAAKDPLRIGCLPEIVRLTLRARILPRVGVDNEERLSVTANS